MYDSSTGLLAAVMLPGDPTPSDVDETDFVYYTVGTNSLQASCGGHPEWAGLLCFTTPYAEPTPNLATTQVTKYNFYGEPETTIDTNGSDNRTTTITYDAAGRQLTKSITGTSSAGATVPTVTTAYDTATGQPYTTTDGTNTITRHYDALDASARTKTPRATPAPTPTTRSTAVHANPRWAGREQRRGLHLRRLGQRSPRLTHRRLVHRQHRLDHRQLLSYL